MIEQDDDQSCRRGFFLSGGRVLPSSIYGVEIDRFLTSDNGWTKKAYVYIEEICLYAEYSVMLGEPGLREPGSIRFLSIYPGRQVCFVA